MKLAQSQPGRRFVLNLQFYLVLLNFGGVQNSCQPENHPVIPIYFLHVPSIVATLLSGHLPHVNYRVMLDNLNHLWYSIIQTLCKTHYKPEPWTPIQKKYQCKQKLICPQWWEISLKPAVNIVRSEELHCFAGYINSRLLRTDNIFGGHRLVCQCCQLT